MPSPSASDPIAELALTLLAYERAAEALVSAAPKACESLGGAEAIMDRCGGAMIRKGWWAVTLDDETWSALAAEQQAQYRGGDEA